MRHTGKATRLAGASARTSGGFTLLELLLVLGILIALASIVLPRMDAMLNGDEEGDGARPRITLASMATIRTAIVGTPELPGFLQDLGEVPARLEHLLVVEIDAPPITLPSGRLVTAYDPFRRSGWNGPYLQRGAGSYQSNANGFTAAYGTDGQPTVLDPWNHPIVLQWPDATTAPDLSVRQRNVRLVSAGPDGVLDTPADLIVPDPVTHELPTFGDDLRLFLTGDGQ